MKKSVKIILIIAACVAVLGAAAGVFLALNTFVGGEMISVGATELDMSDKGLTDVSGLMRCKKLESLDLRGNEISAMQFDELRDALPECEILWSVPIGMERFDSNIAEFSLAADYVEDLYNIAYFTEISSSDVSGTAADDERLYDLNMSIPNINIYWTANINGEEYQTNVKELDFSKTVLQDTSVLKYFTELTSLSLAANTLDDFSVLQGLTKLEYLDVSGNHVTDISALAGMTELKELDLSETWSNDGIKDLTPLAGLTKLEVLNLNQCSGENYEVVTQLPNLKELDLTYFGDAATDFSFIGKMTTLEKLTLKYSGLMNDDLKYLSGLNNLKELDLYGIYVSDPSPLHSLTGLEKLTIREDGVSADEKSALAAALPDCDISWS